MNSIQTKKVATCFFITLLIFLLTACSGANNASSTNTGNNQAINITKNTSDNENTEDASSSSNNTVDNQSTSSTPAKQQNSQKTLLEDIKNFGKQGKVINCDYAAKVTTLSSVEEKWGKADKSEWITAAKGMYSTYSKHNVVFGTNKGAQVFEVRSFDSRLKEISMSTLKNTFGAPQHDVKSNGEEIIGYTTGTDFKLLFVFSLPKNNNSNPSLKHYSVFYPKGTVNNMASDRGREW